MTTERTEKKRILTPVGRLINEALFEKDQFNDEAKAYYKIEMAFPWADVEGLEDALQDHAEEKWGASAGKDYVEGLIISPLLDGDKLAARREEKGKVGDAYKGMAVLRAKTLFNKYGQDAPGGIFVCGPDGPTEEIGAANRGEIYSGCYGQAALTIDTYDDSRSGDHALTFYLSGFQKIKDGERLMSARDFSEVFKPVGRTEGEGPARRRKRG